MNGLPGIPFQTQSKKLFSKILDGAHRKKKKERRGEKVLLQEKLQLFQVAFIRVVADGIAVDGTTAEK